MVNVEIHYSNNEAHPAFPLTLTIDASGMATVVVGTNQDSPGVGMVGVFRRKLESHEISALISSLRSDDFKNIQKPLHISPGEPIRKLRFKEDGKEIIDRWVAYRTKPVPYFLNVEKKVLELISLVRQHPVYAVEMQVNSKPEQLDRGKSIELGAIIINSGTEAIKLIHPNNWVGKDVEFQIIGLRSDIPLEQLEAYHQKFENLSAANIRNIQGKTIAASNIIIAPNDRLELVSQSSLDWPPGQYDISLSFGFPILDENGIEKMNCKLVSKSMPLKILGESKPGDEPSELDENEEME